MKDYNKILRKFHRTLSFFIYAKDFSMFNTPYDYESITHYGATAFSKDEKPTIVSKEPGGDLIMVRIIFHEEKLSFITIYNRDKGLISAREI